MKAILAIEDGTVERGLSIGQTGTSFGELVFNTSMTGYQEIYTDPSYAGEIVMLTYPLIGNYGANETDVESHKSHARGIVVKELAEGPNSWRMQFSLTDFLKRHHVIGIAGADTRALTRRIRSFGAMRAGISTELTSAELLEAVRNSPRLSGQDLVSQVTTSAPYRFLYEMEKGGEEKSESGDALQICILDFGMKYNIPRSFIRRGCRVEVLPAATKAAEILEHRPHGVALSNGPGDPKDAPYALETIRGLLGKVPIMGICLGHQLLALALGCDTYKLKFGHRGANQPVKDMRSGRVVVTSQNHGYAVADEGLDRLGVEASMRNVNDGTIEGIRHREHPMLSVQFHPEASPGPLDSGYLFDDFLKIVGEFGR